MPGPALKPYRLKAGGYSAKSGEETQYFFSNDPNRNIVMSGEDLALLEPMKFEEYKGPIPKNLQGVTQARFGTDMPGSVSASGSGPGVGPTTEADVLAAQAISGDVSPEVLLSRADEMEKLVKALRESAKRGQEAAKQNAKGGGAGDETAEGQAAGNTQKNKTPSAEELQGMSKADLLALGEEREVHVTKSMNKDELIAAIQGK